MSKSSGFFSFLDNLTYVENDSSSYEIEIGDNGFSYLDMVSEKRARRLTFEEKQGRQTSAALDGSTRARGKLNVKKLETVNHDTVCFDTDLEGILRDIRERRENLSYFPFAAGFTGLLLLVWLLLPWVLDHAWLAMLLSGILLFPGGFLLLWNVWKLDLSRKHAKFTYRFSGTGSAAFESINGAIGNLHASDQVLLYSGRRHFEDTRYSGGATSLPLFEMVALNRKKPPLLDLDFDVWHVRAFRRDIFFMPDHVLVFDGARVGVVKYSQLKLSSDVEVTQAREKAKQTGDCKVVGTTYRFVNNDGTPDERFNDNIQIPLIEYGIFSLRGSGIELDLYASRQRSATMAPNAFTHMQRLAGMPVQKVAEARRKKAKADSNGGHPNLYDVLIDALCCVMVADGRASVSEKRRIQELLVKANPAWDTSRIQKKIAVYLRRLKQEGYRSVLRKTRDNLRLLKVGENKKIILYCLDAVAKADGALEEAELQVCAQFRQVLE